MSEFLNYKVELTFIDGHKSSGLIESVDSSCIVLKKAVKYSNPKEVLDNLNVNNSNVADLKVLQVPPELLKSNAKLKVSSRPPDYQNEKPPSDAILLDDAIVFMKPVNSDSKEEGSLVGANSSQATPKPRFEKPEKKGNSDWGHDESIQDIKSSTDFDFAANLAMFDKKSVFADFQKQDFVNPSERLVGHNKNVSSKSKSDDKYSNDEMVLDSNRKDNWDSIGNSSAPSSSSSIGNLQSTKESKSLTPLRQLMTSPLRDIRFCNSQNSQVLPTCSPVQLLEIERLSNEKFGIGPSFLDESFAYNMAPLICNRILGGANRLSNQKNHNFPPLVLLFVGSPRCGDRAFSLGRVLANHGIRVLAYVLTSDDYSKEVSENWKIFEKCGGKVILSDFPFLLKTLEELHTPVELIIDALQGYDEHLDDIFYKESDIKELTRIISWCNEPTRSKRVMSLDIPSGIDGGSGTIPNDNLKLNCKWCVSMGLPISGLIHAYKNGNLAWTNEEEIVHYLVDIGIPNSVYNVKANLRKFDKIWHNSDFTIKIKIANE